MLRVVATGAARTGVVSRPVVGERAVGGAARRLRARIQGVEPCVLEARGARWYA